MAVIECLTKALRKHHGKVSVLVFGCNSEIACCLHYYRGQALISFSVLESYFALLWSFDIFRKGKPILFTLIFLMVDEMTKSPSVCFRQPPFTLNVCC